MQVFKLSGENGTVYSTNYFNPSLADNTITPSFTKHRKKGLEKRAIKDTILSSFN